MNEKRMETKLQNIIAFRNRVPNAVMYGIEVEFENVSAPDAADPPTGWFSHTDGSLRNNGMEFVTAPTYYSRIEAPVNRLYLRKRRHGWRTSSRTGTHIHVNMRQYTLEQIRRVLAVYTLTESALFAYIGHGRSESIFCVPYYKAPSPLENYSRFMRNFHYKINKVKYSALNLNTITNNSLGTLEFRHAPTWEEPESLIKWIRILHRLCTKAHTITVERAVELARHDIDLLIGTVYGDYADELIALNVPSLEVTDADDLVNRFLVEPCTYKDSSKKEWPKPNIDRPPVIKKTKPRSNITFETIGDFGPVIYTAVAEDAARERIRRLLDNPQL